MTSPPVPPLPKISGDIILETFTHKSLRLEGSIYSDEHSGDNERLSELGEKVVQLAVTEILFRKRPILGISEISNERDKILSIENVETWLGAYGLRNSLRFLPSDATNINTNEEGRHLFHAYIGAVYVQSGMSTVTKWLAQLIEPESPHLEGSLNTWRRGKGDTAPPPFPDAQYSSPSSPGSAKQTVVTYLPRFNERCAQSHLKVEYEAENQGLPHAPLWVMKCMVNGILKGQGQGPSKQAAKEEAAKQAYIAMGFANFG